MLNVTILILYTIITYHRGYRPVLSRNGKVNKYISESIHGVMKLFVYHFVTIFATFEIYPFLAIKPGSRTILRQDLTHTFTNTLNPNPYSYRNPKPYPNPNLYHNKVLSQYSAIP